MRNAIGIDIGGTNTRAARVSSAGQILEHQAGPTARSPEAILADLKGMVTKLRDDDTSAIGIGVPGRVDAGNQRIISGGYIDLPTLSAVSLLQQETGLETFADNDANMAMFGEARAGAAREYVHAVMLTIGTGIGGSILADRRIFHGAATAGQLGHITVTCKGERCNCGRRGCLETASSGTALARHKARHGIPAVTPIAELLQSDQPAALAVIADWALPLRAGIDSLAAAFGPEIVILGGGLGAAAVKALERFPAVSPWFQYPVAAAMLGDEAGVIGAALAALEHYP